MIFQRLPATIVGLLLPSFLLTAQTERRGDLFAYVDSSVNAMPAGLGTNEYFPPTEGQFDVFRSAVQDLLEGRPGAADAAAVSIGYRVVAFVDTTGPAQTSHLVLERHPDSARHWGMAIIANNAQRPELILQCPHPLFDTKSAHQGAWIYRIVGARAMIVSGAHRCNLALPSPCAGTTTVCSGGAEPFRRSDPAHNVDHPLQATTIAVLATITQPLVIQLHGFAKDPGDPDLILSNGTRSQPLPDPILTLREEFLKVDDSLTFKIAHIDSTWNLLTGTTNVQGRLINGSPSPCSQSASVSTGRFIHMEQAYARLRDNSISWSRVANAIANAFPATATGVKGDAPSISHRLDISAHPNPFNPSTIIRFQLPVSAFVRAGAFDLSGRSLGTIFEGRFAAGSHSATWEPNLPSGTYLLRVDAISEQDSRSHSVGSIKLLLVR
jgi:hypothetical protein